MTEIHKKGWGYENWLVNCPLYCGKILHFNKGKQCSLHYHKIKDETFYILKGKIALSIMEGSHLVQKTLKEGDTFHVMPRMIHSMKGLTDADMIEISTQHFEDDSYRIIKGD